MRYEDLYFEVAHIGINCENENQAAQVANMFSLLFDYDIKTGNSSIFAGGQIEIMKKKYLGEKGHIAIKTNSMDTAIKKLREKGFEFNMKTLKKSSDGKKKAVYLCEEIGGFAVHLLKAD